MNADEAELNRLTHAIIGCAYRVHNGLGCGFMEKVYENAMAHELRKLHFQVAQQQPIKVWYDGVMVGEYVADLVVQGIVLVELKAVSEINDVYAAQCINYLTATGLPICLLINFGKKVEVKRFRGRQEDHS
jgi:GxxExxY protein